MLSRRDHTTPAHTLILYEVQLLSNPALWPRLPGQLLVSSLDWCWESSPCSSRAPNVPWTPLPSRPLTYLTLEETPALLADLSEHNERYPRAFSFFGVDLGMGKTILNMSKRKSFLEAFASHAAEPIRVVMVQEGDMDNDYVFVAHKHIEHVHDLLKQWGIASTATQAIYDDSRRIFESLFGLSHSGK